MYLMYLEQDNLIVHSDCKDTWKKKTVKHHFCSCDLQEPEGAGHEPMVLVTGSIYLMILMILSYYL